jgi:quercetin dioxygenase-like cupin family protein
MELDVVLDSAITGGQLSVVRIRARRGDASPVHIHSRDDEAFLLIEGEMTVWVGNNRYKLLPAGVGFLPREAPHAFRFDANSVALTLTTPAGQENFFRSAGWDLSKPRPEGWVISPDSLREAAAENGVTVVAPPHGLED